VFIDADHTHRGVEADIRAWWPKIRRGGMLLGHDFQPAFPGVQRAVTERFGVPQVFADNVWGVWKRD
jgi:hypothetical protein